MRGAFVKVQRPVQYVDMGAEFFLHLRKKFHSNLCQQFPRNRFLYCPDLVNAFFRAGLVVSEQVIHRPVALCVPVLFVPLILRLYMVCIMLIIINPFNLLKRIIVFPALSLSGQKISRYNNPSKYSALSVPCRYVHCSPHQISGHCVWDCKRRFFPALPLCLVSFILSSFFSIFSLREGQLLLPKRVVKYMAFSCKIRVRVFRVHSKNSKSR